MDLYALDSSFQLVSIGIPYDNLQWSRRYYESGFFMVQLPLRVYDPSWDYIGTKDRPELGMIQQRQYSGEGDVQVLLSGFFCEKMLDDKTCYPRYIGDVSKTETAVRNIFTKYKDDLPVQLGPANDPLLGDRTQSDFSDDFLGDKLFRILESRECSYRVEYDYVNNHLLFNVWQGLDRTQSQSGPIEEHNAYQTFSTDFGNLTDKTANFDESAYKNYAIIPVDADDNGKERTTYYLDWSNGKYKKEITFDMRASKPEEGQSEADFKASVLQEVSERMLAYAKVENVDIEQAGNKGYMVDYDLGDKCDVLLTDIGVQMESRIVEVNEVFKADGGHTATIGLGNKRISNIRRAMNSI